MTPFEYVLIGVVASLVAVAGGFTLGWFAGGYFPADEL